MSCFRRSARRYESIVLVAMATGADVAMISSFHIFRIFFILFVVAPVIGFFLRGGISKFHQKDRLCHVKFKR